MAPGSIAHYSLLSPLGAGGMGEVFLARDERLGRDVAIKLLPRDAASAPQAIERFRREARAASAISHPNIITVFDVGEVDGIWYLAMELVRGRTLAEDRGTPWPIAQAADVLAQGATALAAAHEAGIVHRDIKPANIMVRHDGYVKVLDFGIARLANTERHDAAPLTEPGKVIGTLTYLSPEQATGESVEAPSDVFSLGILAYELFTGAHPFKAPTSMATFTAILTRDPVPAAELRAELPESVQALLAAMLDKEPARRPSTADVAATLRSVTAGAARTPLVTGARPVGPAAGSAQATAATTVLASVAAVPAAPSAPRHHGIVVGRAQDLAMLQTAYVDVLQGSGLVVSVEGEPGIGKSTLVESVLTELRYVTPRPTIAMGRCSERLAGAEAYLPVLDALETALERDATGAFAEQLTRFAPGWAMLLGRVPEGASVGTAVPASQERLKREMAALLEFLSTQAPVVLLLDDIHWADESTVDLLAYLTTRFDRMRLLVLVTGRDSDMRAAKHPYLKVQQDLHARGLERTVTVGRLSADDVSEYLRRTYPGHAFPAELARAVHTRSGGNPLFVAEVIRWLNTLGVIAERNGRWSLDRPVADISDELPSTVRSMIERKLAQVGDDDRRLLGAAAVQGAAFDSATVAAMLKADAADIEEQLIVLEKVYGFLTSTGDITFPDGTMAVAYRFAHALFQNVLASSVAPSRRAAWSAAAADVLEERYGTAAAEIAGTLALLRATGRQPARAAQWYIAAAQRAIGTFAYVEAERLAARGLEQVALLNDPAVRVGLELPLRLVAGATSLVRRGFAAPETAENMAQASAMCLAIGETPSLMPALWVLVLYSIAHGSLEDAAVLCHQMQQIGEASEAPALRACGRMVFIGYNVHRGQLAAAQDAHDAVAAVMNDPVRAALRATFQPDPMLTGHSEYIRLLWLTNRFAEAQQERRHLEQLVAAIGDPQGQAFVALFAAELDIMRGRYAEAIEAAAAGIALCEEHGIASERLWCTFYLGMAHAAQGNPAAGVPLMRAALGPLHAIEAYVGVPFFQAALAEAELALGHVIEAQQEVECGLALAAQTGEHVWDAELWRVQAKILRRAPGARADGLTSSDARVRARQAVAASGALALGARLDADEKTAG